MPQQPGSGLRQIAAKHRTFNVMVSNLAGWQNARQLD
jgi:hypothetical protein